MALLGNGIANSMANSIEDAENQKQFEGEIPPYIISGQLFPRMTP